MDQAEVPEEKVPDPQGPDKYVICATIVEWGE